MVENERKTNFNEIVKISQEFHKIEDKIYQEAGINPLLNFYLPKELFNNKWIITTMSKKKDTKNCRIKYIGHGDDLDIECDYFPILGSNIDTNIFITKLIKDMILKYRKKLRIMLNIYGGKFKGKCTECNTDIKMLPALELHHPLKSMKSNSFAKAKYRIDFKTLIEQLEKESVVILCGNCHSKKQSNIYYRFNPIIMKKDLFNLSGESIHKLIRDEVYRRIKDYRQQNIFRIKHWIKKRYIFEKLYDGICVGCGEVMLNDLPVIDLHHRDNKTNLRSKWQRIKNIDLPALTKIIINENIVCLCSNCHRMVKNEEFIDNLSSIYIGDLKDLIPNIKKIYYNIIHNIQNFKFPNVPTYDILKRETIHDRWKNNLLDLFKILLKNNNFRFNRAIIERLLNCNEYTARYRINRLKNLGYVETIKKSQPRVQAIYRLTDRGIKKAKELWYETSKV